MFEHSDLWHQADQQTFSDLKDYMLFALPELYSSCDAKDLQPCSRTEMIMQNKIAPEGYVYGVHGVGPTCTGFSMKVDI